MTPDRQMQLPDAIAPPFDLPVRPPLPDARRDAVARLSEAFLEAAVAARELDIVQGRPVWERYAQHLEARAMAAQLYLEEHAP